MIERGTTYAGDTGLGGEYTVQIVEGGAASLFTVEDVNGDEMVRWFRGAAEAIDQLEKLENDFTNLNYNGLVSSIVLSSDYIDHRWALESPYVGTGVHAVERDWHIENGRVSTVHQAGEFGNAEPVGVKFTDFRGSLEFVATDLTPAGLCAILDSRCTAEERDQILGEAIGMGAWE